jgi:hypothetical protein
MLKARVIIEQIAAVEVVPLMRAAGFAKKRLSFHRSRGETLQVLEVQLSSWNLGSDGQFYVNVGVLFHQLYALQGRVVPPRPTPSQCDFQVRLNCLFPDAPAEWSVNSQTDIEATGKALGSYARRVISTLNDVDSAEAFLKTGWDRAMPWGFPARLRYITGACHEAKQLLEQEAAFFADRGVTYATLLEVYGLHDLER